MIDVLIIIWYDNRVVVNKIKNMANDLDFNSIKRLLDQAEDCLIKARKIFFDYYLSGKTDKILLKSDSENIIEGVFDGENMVCPDQKIYPVPQNYASKSKLIPGDGLKLTITEDGSYLFKQISPAKRKKVIGELYEILDKYIVDVSGKKYQVLKASVTYFKAKPGNRLTVIVPEDGRSEWAAVENVVEAGTEMEKE